MTEQFAATPADRLSDHRYLANLFRLYLHTMALNLLAHSRGNRLRGILSLLGDRPDFCAVDRV